MLHFMAFDHYVPVSFVNVVAWCQAFWIVRGCRVSGPAALSESKDEMASCILDSL